MALQPLYYEPGISKQQTDYSAKSAMSFAAERMARGRWVDGAYHRFLAGFPEKIGGWIDAGLGPIQDIAHAQKTWRAVNGDVNMMIGTTTRLYVWDGTTTTDVTPLRTLVTGSLSSNPITASSGSQLMVVADTSARIADKDWVFLNASAPAGGLIINGWYQASSVVPGTGYSITVPVPAASSGAGGGTVATGYPRVRLGTNPFATGAGILRVTVTQTAHGCTVGDFVTFSGATPVAGLDLNGEFQVVLVVDPDHYQIDAPAPPNANTSGGGTAVSVVAMVPTPNLSALPFGGYGTGPYGAGPYGVTLGGRKLQVINGWTLAAYGGVMAAGQVGGTIYFYDPIAGGRAYPLLNAPNSIVAMFITPERFIVALGNATNAMQMAWCDQDVPTQWTSLPNNTANSGRTLIGGNLLLAGVAVGNFINLIFSDRCAFQMQYTGDAEVYTTTLISDNSGIAGPWAVATVGDAAYWIGDTDLWTYNGAVSLLPSDDIRRYVFDGNNMLRMCDCWTGSNREFREIWFGYPSASSNEVDSYVIYHTDQQCWSIGPPGTIPRTSWVDRDLLNYPYAIDSNGTMWQHETGVDAGGAAMPSYLTGAVMDIGDQTMLVTGFIADLQRWTGPLTLTLNTRYYPEDENAQAVMDLGTADTVPRLDLRLDGKLAGIELASNAIGGDWRLGMNRLDVVPSGARL